MFGRNKKASQKRDVDSDVEPLAEELPEKTTNLKLRTAAPKTTRFNKKVVFLIVGLVFLVFLSTLFSIFQPAKPKGQPEENQGKAAATGEDTPYSEALGDSGMPETFTQVSGNYGEVIEKEKEAKRKALLEESFKQPQVPIVPAIDPTQPPTPSARMQIRTGSNDRGDHGDNDNKSEIRTPAEQLKEQEALEQLRKQFEAQKSGLGFAVNQGQGGMDSFGGDVAGGLPGGQNQQQLDPVEMIKTITENLPGAGQGASGLNGFGGGGEDNSNSLAYFSGNSGGGGFALSGKLEATKSPYIVSAGSFIPCTVKQGINSDLPGYVTAQVRENVYDTVTGNYLLIPQGSMLWGQYDSDINFAQKRIMVVWQRIQFPNGATLNLEGMPGVDLSGYSGLSDQVDNHWLRIISSVVLSSGIAAATKIVTNDTNESDEESFSDLAGSGAAESVNDLGKQLTEKNLKISPTLKFRPGNRFNILVHKDMILRPYQYRRT